MLKAVRLTRLVNDDVEDMVFSRGYHSTPIDPVLLKKAVKEAEEYLNQKRLKSSDNKKSYQHNL
jgi:hypothetical protein